MHLTKIEPQANQFRFYRMEIVPGLFGDWGLIREWGRIGSGGRVRTDWFECEADAKDARFTLHMQKAKRGYESVDAIKLHNPEAFQSIKCFETVAWKG